MSDLQTYETTQLDWAAIESLAVRAAKETPLKPAPPLGYVKKNGEEFVDVCGPHWVLDKRYEWNVEVSGYVTEESYHEVLYVLTSEGQLVQILISEETNIHRTNPSNFSCCNTHSVHPMTEGDITSFDFARGSHESGYGTDRHIWGNSDRVYSRKELLQTRKGAGLSLLLENIRTGRAKRDEKLSSAQETGETRAQLLPDLTRFHHTTEERAKVIADLRNTRDKAVTSQKSAARTRGIRNALSAAGRRTLLLAGVWLLVSFIIFANNSDMSISPGFAEGSYSVVTWSLIFALIGGLIIDLFVGEGRDGAFLTGAAVGIAVLVYSVLSKPNVASREFDISLFFLTVIFGLTAYLVSSLVRRIRRTR